LVCFVAIIYGGFPTAADIQKDEQCFDPEKMLDTPTDAQWGVMRNHGSKKQFAPPLGFANKLFERNCP
jgi:hypothetical protein